MDGFLVSCFAHFEHGMMMIGGNDERWVIGGVGMEWGFNGITGLYDIYRLLFFLFLPRPLLLLLHYGLCNDYLISRGFEQGSCCRVCARVDGGVLLLAYNPANEHRSDRASSRI